MQEELLRKQLDIISEGEVPVGEQNLEVVGVSVSLKCHRTTASKETMWCLKARALERA